MSVVEEYIKTIEMLKPNAVPASKNVCIALDFPSFQVVKLEYERNSWLNPATVIISPG